MDYARIVYMICITDIENDFNKVLEYSVSKIQISSIIVKHVFPREKCFSKIDCVNKFIKNQFLFTMKRYYSSW